MSERLQLTLVPGSFDDWFVLHGGANWASIEGNAEEWREVADALEAGKGDVRHKRLAATLRNGEWGFYSPRNAASPRDHVTRTRGRSRRRLRVGRQRSGCAPRAPGRASGRGLALTAVIAAGLTLGTVAALMLSGWARRGGVR